MVAVLWLVILIQACIVLRAQEAILANTTAVGASETGNGSAPSVADFAAEDPVTTIVNNSSNGEAVNATENIPVEASHNASYNNVPISTHTCGVKNADGTVRPLRIMTSSTLEYFPVFMNWLVYFHRICPSVANIYFICLDTAIEKQLPKYGLSCAHVFHVSAATAVHDIWLVRTRLTHSLLENGYDVLLTDADALWLNNPFPYIEQYISSDIVSSRGSFPESIGKKLGATLCMGFTFVKANEYTSKLWAEIAAQMAKQPNPDDQREVNSVLFNHNLHYAIKPTYVGSTEYSTGHFTLHGHEYGVTLLPHAKFRRICDQEKVGDVKSSVVAHCLSHQKVGKSKISMAETLGMWRLKPNWEQEEVHGDLAKYLHSITVREESKKRIMRAALVRGVRRLYVQTSASMTAANSVSDRSSLALDYVRRGGNNNTESASLRGTLATSSSTVTMCLEYHQNRHIFNASDLMSGDSNCWYVSTEAPESSIRQFEQIVSSAIMWG